MLGSRPVTTDLRAQREQTEQRKKLLACVDHETAVINQFTAALQQQANDLNSKECLAAVEQTINAIERVFNAGDWESSLFLRNTVKPLKALYNEMLQLRTLLTGDTYNRIVPPKLREGFIPVYISLFQTESTHLGKWAMQIRALPNYVQNRPIYRHENEVERFIYSKLDSSAEAYVVVAINPEMIVSQENSRVDRNGFTLLTLVDRAVQYENIIEFVHQRKRYCIIDNKLVEQN